MAVGGMHTNEVKAVVRELELNGLDKTTNSKAIMSGTRLGEKSGAGSHKESGFSRGTKKGK